MTEFKREDRYLVIKRKDLAKLPASLLEQFEEALGKVQVCLPDRICVVVEADWPEYVAFWKMIEDRCSTREKT